MMTIQHLKQAEDKQDPSSVGQARLGLIFRNCNGPWWAQMRRARQKN